MCGEEAQKLNHKAYKMNLGPSLTSEKHQKKIIEAGAVAYYNIFKEIDILVTR